MKDFEQSLANAADDSGNVKDVDVMDLLGDAMTLGESWAESQQSGGPDAAPTTEPAPAPATPPAPAPAAPAPAPAAPTPAPATAPAAAPGAEPTPVVLAKDGVHTIGYDKLVEARQEAATAKAEAARLAVELTEARRVAPAPAPAAPAAAPAPAADADTPLFGDYTDSDLRKGVQTLLDQQAATLRAEFEGKLKPVEVERQVSAQNAHLTTILTAHPDASSIVESQEFEAWKAALPSFTRAGIEAVQDKGSATEMVEVLNTYRAAHPRQAAAAAPAPVAAPAAPAAAPTAAQLAAKAIAGAQERTPTTLSDIPAGSQAVTDESAALAQQSPVDLLDRMLSMSPEQIEAFQARFV